MAPAAMGRKRQICRLSLIPKWRISCVRSTITEGFPGFTGKFCYTHCVPCLGTQTERLEPKTFAYLTRLRGRGLCALIQAETATGTIDFDYAGYAQKRFAEYEAWRQVQDSDIPRMPLREEIWARP